MMEITNNMASLFLDAANTHPNAVAIIYKKEKITYKQLEQEVKMYAAYLVRKGIKPGDRVLVFVPMSIALYKTVLAVFYIGAIAVFLDEWVSKDRMELCCSIAKCKAFIAPWKIRLLALFSKEIRNIPIKVNISCKNELSTVPLYSSLPEDTALITFTTGSTGNPKAANRTHHFLRAQYAALQPILPEHSNIDMTLLPIVLLLNLGKGRTSVIAKFNPGKPNKFEPKDLYFQLEREKVESITFSPFYLIETANYLINNNLSLPHLKSIISGGGPVFPNDAIAIKKAFPNAYCLIVYGSTEAEPIAHINLERFLEVTDTIAVYQGLFVGKVDDSATVKIIPIFNGIVNTLQPLPVKSGGEIVVSGEHVLSSYFNSDEAFRLNKIQDNNLIWHRTGDAGWISENNELFLRGRCKQIIHWQNRDYYPFLIEQYLTSIPGIKRGTLILPKNKPLLIIQPEIEVDNKTIISALKNSMYSEFSILFIKHIPMDKRHNTKIDYDALQLVVANK